MELYTKKDNKLFKDLETKYRMIELGSSDEDADYMRILELAPKHILDKKYGECRVFSVQNYDDTKTTSVFIEDQDNFKGLKILMRRKKEDIWNRREY